MASLEPILTTARELLILRASSSAADHWLWEHSERVMRLSRMIALLPEFGEERPDPTAVALAALFHDAGWAVQAKQGQVSCWQVLARPTSDVQRELGVKALRDRTAGLIEPETLELAAGAIRECNNRFSSLPEAQALSEAENLDEIGVLSVLRQFRQHQVEGKPVEQLLVTWTRQLEYHYWDARISDYLRFETTRRIARERLASVELFMSALARDRESVDVLKALKAEQIDITSVSQ